MSENFRGFPACSCLIAWLPAYEAELQRVGALVGPLRIYQLIGNAPASGGVHRTGGAFDITDLVGEQDVWVARHMGADATWARTATQGFTPHIHGVLRGCPHNGPARYQIDAVDAGFNGLGTGGRGGRDDGPRPLSGRTWREGIEWARKRGDDMFEKEDRERLARVEAQLTALATAEKERAAEFRDALRRQVGALRAKLRAENVILEEVQADVDRLLALAEDDS